MRRVLVLMLLVLAGCGDAEAPQEPRGPLLSGSATRLDGRSERLDRYAGKVVLVVNTASECGFTPQFEGLQALYESRRDRGLVLLGFPSNDFGGQEPRADQAIRDFCTRNFGVTFPMFARTPVTGEEAHPLFKRLGAPDWNFNKYLLDKQGRLVERWGSTTEPEALGPAIDRLL